MNKKISNQRAEKIQTVPMLFKDYLENRGIKGDEAIRKFLYPSLKDLRKPGEMKDLPEAAKLVAKFIAEKRQIIVWGDYDVDGTTGTALLVNLFRELGTKVLWHIPDRLKEGYGLNILWFQENKKTILQDDFLLITVDCGISNANEIEIIKKNGGRVIVTDHHSLPETSTPNCLVLNPSQSACGFHDEHLAGVGVAFYLAAGVRAELARDIQYKKKAANINLKKYLVFVALGTVADVVNMTTINRILVRGGIEALADSSFTGLKELLNSCEITGDTVSTEDIGYLIGPKINAAGRLGESRVVVELLTEQDKKTAVKLAKKLTQLNLERRRVSLSDLEYTLSILSSAQVEHNKCAIVKGDLHQGVAGIVASRLVDKYKVPAIVFAKKRQPNGQVAYLGSARSVVGVSVLELLTQCSELIDRFGGHEMAAGLTVLENNFSAFDAKFSNLTRKVMENRQIQPKKGYDISGPVDTVMNEEHLNCLKLLEPFGPGNPQPVFLDPDVEIIDSRTVGRNQEHLQITIRGKYSNLKGIGFGFGEFLNDIQRHPRRKLNFTPTANRFRGNVSWQVRVVDI